MTVARILSELKRDGLGSVELLGTESGKVVRRVATGSRIPLSGRIARYLGRREARALERLAGLDGVPELLQRQDLYGFPSLDGEVLSSGDVVLRSYIEGLPLHRAVELPEDFFDCLDELVAALHQRGVCHNDLHKEQNILVQTCGRPALIDFQLASCHGERGYRFRSRVHDDLRHVQKHRRRYTRDGRGPAAAGVQHGAGLGKRRTPLAWVWRRCGKPLYLLLTRGVLRRRDGEERRPSSGPWPTWKAPVRPRSSGPDSGS